MNWSEVDYKLDRVRATVRFNVSAPFTKPNFKYFTGKISVPRQDAFPVLVSLVGSKILNIPGFAEVFLNTEDLNSRFIYFEWEEAEGIGVEPNEQQTKTS